MDRFSRRVQAALLSSACLWTFPAEAVAQTSDPVPAPAPVAATAPTAVTGTRAYTPADFARFAPRNALDMLQQVPGFVIRQADQARGLGEASENVLLNGQRVSTKSGGAITELAKIPANNVARIEIVDAATLGIAGLTGQVANIIVKDEKKASGQFSWRPEIRTHFADPLLTRGDISYSGQIGPVEYTLGLNGQGSRSGAGGPTTILTPEGEVAELREDDWHGNFDAPKLSGRFTLGGGGTSVGNLNLAYEPNFFTYREDGVRQRPGEPDRLRSVRLRERGFEFEAGGDYQFALGPGQLKLIGLRSFEHKPKTSTAIVDFADGSPSVGDRVTVDGRQGEWIGRSEYSWKSGSSDWQVSGEAAFNSVDSVTRIFALQPDGEFTAIPFPAGTGRVHEDRYELLGTFGRPLGDTLTVQLVGGGEYSTLSSESALNTLTRSYFRPKGSASLAWQHSDDLDVSLKVRRRVGQLDFFDFLASVNLTDDRKNAGNLELVPPQSWEVDLQANRKLGSWGNSSLRLFGELIDDIVDIVPIGESGQSPGNIDQARLYGVEWKGTWLFDNLGVTGAKLDTLVTLQRSRLEDPLTGETRPVSNALQRQVHLNLRHDIPGSSWAWGSSLNDHRFAKSFWPTEVGRMWQGPLFVSAFVEHKDVAGLTVRAGLNNILNARSRWDRNVFAGFRDSNPILFVERRNRFMGPSFSFSVRGNV